MFPVSCTASRRSIDDRKIAALRVILAVSVLLATYIIPSELGVSVTVAYYTSLALYVVYSTALFGRILYRNPRWLASIEHWIDVGWYVMLVGVSHGTHSIYFPLIFAILIASLRWGFETGLRVTAVSVVLFTGVGFFMTPAVADFTRDHLLMRSTMLVVFGYVIASWGGFEVTSQRQFALLKNISTFANSRFGVDRTLGSLMEQLRAFYDADTCLLVIANPRTGGYDLRCVDYRDPGAAERAEPMPEGLAHLLLDLPATQAAVSRHRPYLWAWWCREVSGRTYDVGTGEGGSAAPHISGMPEAGSFITVPIRLCDETVGRFYLTASRRCAFDTSDMRFLLQVLEQTMPTIENIRLVHELAVTAAEMERQRIAYDVHDSVIQPYIGLKTGLIGIDQKLTAGKIDVQEDIRQLLETIDMEVAALRLYAARLRANDEREDRLLLLAQRFAEKFTKATGIAVHVEAKTPLDVHSRLVAELFQIVVEGLSNVRRHTHSAWAIISFMICHGHLILRIANDIAEGEVSRPFIPRSITERTAALGGHTRVEQSEGKGTIVIVDVPL